MNLTSFALLIEGGRIIDPYRGRDEVGDLLIVEGKILQVGGRISESPSFRHIVSKALRLDAKGLFVSPGFVDLHCHLREPGFEEKETIATGTKAAARGGFTVVCCMPNTCPPLDNPSTVFWVRQKAAEEGVVTVLPVGCVTEGRQGKKLSDMTALAEAGVIGFSDDGEPVANAEHMRLALIKSRELSLPVIDHCEDKALSAKGVMNKGQLSAQLGLKGIPAAAEETIVLRDLILARLTGARVHIAHISTKRSVEFIRAAKEEGISVTAEVTPHHLTLTEQKVVSGLAKSCVKDKERIAAKERAAKLSLNTNAKVNPPLRTEEDIEALIEGLNDDVIDAIATDHAPHTPADKDCGFELAAFGISGLETAFGCLMTLVHCAKLSLTVLLSKLTYEPAKVIGKSGELGTLKPGLPANLAIFDPEREWVVDSHYFVSKGKNTPFDGCKFKGKVMTTIAKGKIVYLDEGLKSRLVSAPSNSNTSEESHG